MCGVLSLSALMTNRLVMGYMRVRPSPALARVVGGVVGEEEHRGQCFHYSELVDEDGAPALRMDSRGRPTGLAGYTPSASAWASARPEVPNGDSAAGSEGLVVNRSTVASYVHLAPTKATAAVIVRGARRSVLVASSHPTATALFAAILDTAALSLAGHWARRRLVAVSAHCAWPPWAAALPRVTRAHVNLAGLTPRQVEEAMSAARAADGATRAGRDVWHSIDMHVLEGTDAGLLDRKSVV